MFKVASQFCETSKMSITSAVGVIALLDEPNVLLKEFALQKLNEIVDEFWPEIADSVEKIEILHEDKSFPQCELAALVVSKVYHHLGSFEDSLTYALGAGNLFDVMSNSEYVQTTIAKCMDFYSQQRVALAEGTPDVKPIDSRLEGIVNRMFQRCLDDGQYKQAIGIAIETRRMDVFRRAILESGDVPAMLTYCLKVCLELLQHRQFRNVVLRCLVDMYRELTTPDYVSMCQCLIFLDDPLAVADILDKLVHGEQDSTLMAYQIAFDLYESATQQFLARVLQALKPTNIVPPASVEEEKTEEVKEVKVEPVLSESEELMKKRLDRLVTILGGELSIELHLQFLIRNNKSDLLILKQTKDAIRVSVCHTATVIANAFMHSGTTSDQFLRDNLDWLSRATNWAKLTATASLGVIHRGHEKEALALMAAYLPREVAATSAGFSEGGGLYALGLIHANHGTNITDYLLQQLKEASNEVIRHGGCLGLGLASMGTQRADVYEQLKFHLYQDDAVTGEAAGMAMGLTMLGSRSQQAIEDMVSYAQETQHEKIMRGLAVGIALTMYGRLEEADDLIDTLAKDKDPILRRAAMHTLALAYCGTGNNQAVRKLLHVAVSDVNDDVRRAAVTALGFLLFRNPEQCPSVVSLLAESYNPHVRYGAAMALGIACAGTGLKEAVALLEPMMNDPVNYVRQGALLASALVLVQHTEFTSSKVKDIRQLYAKVIGDKHEDVMAKFGAILAQGIIDAGGRNVTISLQSRTGHTNMSAVVGLMIFTQYWYWFPSSLCLSLAFAPTAIIGLNSDLKMPKVEYRSNAKPSVYAPPPLLEEKKREEKERVTAAVLSITARAKRREAAHSKITQAASTVATPSAAEKMEVDEQPSSEKSADDKKVKEEKEKPKEEPNFEILSNPARVVRQQLKVVSMAENSKYIPLKDIGIGGIIVMRYGQTDQPEELVEPVAAMGPKVEEEAEPEPPEPFEYIED
ncbi:26S proteasome non-ATPase regulatory subunit 1-like [Daphnia pulicaria]|uniref:26S proteasome non-ATPase regulatory subunit 1-like n=1 Tax=Daphnia pulicaria TaxID=35523 RepID=UPI001EEB25D4|nr:26S proteasome non-ATPase regulatory subunit 1-like [Daphnia pulicaria]